jgi:capsular exopolysaccharide synthesis family protein
VVTLVIVGVGAGAGLTLATTKIYEATAELAVATPSNPDLSRSAADQAVVAERIRSYTGLLSTPAITGVVAGKLGVDEADLASRIRADVSSDRVISVHVTDRVPLDAARLANAVAAQLVTVARDTDRAATGLPITLRLTGPARVPGSPISPDPAAEVGIGAVVGLLLGLGLVVIRYQHDHTVRSRGDVEALGVPVLACVPFAARPHRSPIAFRDGPDSARSESYRVLQGRLQLLDRGGPPRVIAVTSAVPGEGKTTAAINLAAALAVTGAKVCLVELDVRRPSLAATLGLSDELGFTTTLIDRTPVASVLQNVGENFAAITAGPLPDDMGDVVVSIRATSLIRELTSRVDYAIILTAPVLPVADAAHVASLADAVVVVHREGRTTRQQVKRSLHALRRVGVQPAGVVLNVAHTGGRRRAELPLGAGVTGPQDSPDSSAERHRVTVSGTVQPPAGSVKKP